MSFDLEPEVGEREYEQEQDVLALLGVLADEEESVRLAEQAVGEVWFLPCPENAVEIMDEVVVV
jgi:hypothetical protein